MTDAPGDEKAPFSFNRELRFGDCDPSGIAYFPSYLNILSGVVEEFWATIGFPWSVLIPVRKIGTPTVHLTCEFSRPSMFGDILTFELRVRRVGRASVHLAHAVSGSGTQRWRAHQVLVATSLENHRAVPWPDDIRNSLLAHLEVDEAAGRAGFGE